MIVGIAVATMVLSSAARNMPAIAAIVVRTMRRLPSRAAYSVPVSGTSRTLLERSFKFKGTSCPLARQGGGDQSGGREGAGREDRRHHRWGVRPRGGHGARLRGGRY